MAHLIDKDPLVAEIKNRKDNFYSISKSCEKGTPAKAGFYAQAQTLEGILSFTNTLEVKEVDLIIHTIIAECCDWLSMHTNLSHNEIEGCRNLMLTIKDEQLKAQKGEEV